MGRDPSPLSRARVHIFCQWPLEHLRFEETALYIHRVCAQSKPLVSETWFTYNIPLENGTDTGIQRGLLKSQNSESSPWLVCKLFGRSKENEREQDSILSWLQLHQHQHTLPATCASAASARWRAWGDPRSLTGPELDIVYRIRQVLLCWGNTA